MTSENLYGRSVTDFVSDGDHMRWTPEMEGSHCPVTYPVHLPMSNGERGGWGASSNFLGFVKFLLGLRPFVH